MGRSVNYRSDAVNVWYLTLAKVSRLDDEWYWGDFIERLQSDIQARYKSFYTCSRWGGREEHVILESIFAEITVCEYCGMVSISISPRDEYPELAEHWCNQVVPGMTKALSSFGLLVKLGTFNNGESCYERVG